MSGNHALRLAGGAAGEHDVADVFGPERREARLRLLASSRRCSGDERLPAFASEIDSLAQQRQIESAHDIGVAHAKKVRRCDRHDRLCLAQRILHLAALEAGVERNHYTARRLDAEARDHPGWGVLSPQPDPLTRLQSGSDECGGGRQHLVFQLGVGNVQVAVDRGGIIRPQAGRVDDEARNGQRGGRLAHCASCARLRISVIAARASIRLRDSNSIDWASVWCNAALRLALT